MIFKRSLGWKFSLVQLVTIALFAISAIIVGEGLELVKKGVQQQQQNEAKLLDISELISRVQSKQVALNDYVFSKDTKHIDQFQALSAQIDATVLSIQPTVRTNEQKQWLEQYVKQQNEYNTIVNQSIVPAVRAAANTDPALINAASTAHKGLVGSLSQLLESEKANRSKGINQIVSQLKGNTLVLLFSIAVSSIVSLTLVFLVSRNMQRNLNQVVHMADQIANKNLTVPNMDDMEQDEIGKLSTSMNRMKVTLRQMMEQITDTSVSVTGESEKLTRYTGIVGSGSRNIYTTMHELASGAEAQAHSSAELVDRMKLFSDNILAVVHEKEQSNLRSRKMLSMTNEGRTYMEHSIDKMNLIDTSIDHSLALVKGLDEKTKNIAEFIQVIQNIAAQTHILALNAAIEAARAGEHGRGFTVVANQVRKLSEQVFSSISNITTIIDDIQIESNNAVQSLQAGYNTVADGKTLVNTTGETFEQLHDEIHHIGLQIENMSSSLDDVRNQTETIYQFLENVTSIAKQTAASVADVSATAGQFNRSMEEVEHSAAFLDEEAGKLHSLINQFKS